RSRYVSASCIDEQVDAAKGIDRLLHGVHNLIRIRQVDWERQRTWPKRLNVRRDLLEIRHTACQQCNMGAGACQRQRGGSAKPTPGTGHQRDLSGQGGVGQACMIRHMFAPIEYQSILQPLYAISERIFRKTLSCPGTTTSARAAIAFSDC